MPSRLRVPMGPVDVVSASGTPAEPRVAIAGVRVSRRRSLSSQQNDVKILDAALREVDAVGVDGLGMTSVARRAGLTTGALYGRYESSGEVAAALWTTVVRERHFALLDTAVAALVDDGPSAAVRRG